MLEILDLSFGDWKQVTAVTVKVGEQKMSSSNRSQSSRQVFTFDNFVIKFDTGYQNGREIKFYEEYLDAADAKYFPKLLGQGTYGDYSFLIQERVKPLDNQYAKRRDFQIFKRLTKKYQLSDLSFGEPVWNAPKKQHFFNCYMTREGIKIYDIGWNYLA